MQLNVKEMSLNLVQLKQDTVKIKSISPEYKFFDLYNRNI